MNDYWGALSPLHGKDQLTRVLDSLMSEIEFTPRLEVPFILDTEK